jgi:type III secretory pathway component EscR
LTDSNCFDFLNQKFSKSSNQFFNHSCQNKWPTLLHLVTEKEFSISLCLFYNIFFEIKQVFYYISLTVYLPVCLSVLVLFLSNILGKLVNCQFRFFIKVHNKRTNNASKKLKGLSKSYFYLMKSIFSV